MYHTYCFHKALYTFFGASRHRSGKHHFCNAETGRYRMVCFHRPNDVLNLSRLRNTECQRKCYIMIFKLPFLKHEINLIKMENWRQMG